MATSFLGQLGTASAGLGNAIKNLYTMPSQVAQAEAQARLRSAQEAQLRQAMMRNDEAYEARKSKFGDMAGLYANIDSTRADNINTAYMGANKIALLERAGLLRPGTTQNAVEAVNQAYQNINPSMSNDASQTPPISQVGRGGYQEAPPPDTAPQNDVQAFNNAIQQLAMLEKGWSGRDIYGNANKYGVATNKVTGEGNIVDNDSHASAVAYDRARTTAQEAKANKDNRWAPGQGRGGHGGGHRGPRSGKHTRGGTPPKSGYERLKDIAIKNNWSPEKFAEEATKRGFIKK